MPKPSTTPNANDSTSGALYENTIPGSTKVGTLHPSLCEYPQDSDDDVIINLTTTPGNDEQHQNQEEKTKSPTAQINRPTANISPKSPPRRSRRQRPPRHKPQPPTSMKQSTSNSPSNTSRSRSRSKKKNKNQSQR